jgi:replicative DNA helicase
METDIEKNVIGSLILKPEFLQEVSEIISERDFNIDLYRYAFRTMLSMVAKGDEVEITNLYLEMGRPDTASKLSESFDDCIFDPPHYARILKKMNLENEISIAAKKREYEEIQKKVSELKGLGKPVALEIITDVITKGEKKEEIIRTGYRDLDSIVEFERTDLMVLAGRPGVGKSLLACAMLANIAKEHTVGIISFEMSPIKIVKRLALAYSFDYLNSINRNLVIASPSIFNLREIRKALNEMVAKKGVKAVLIDYLQLMSETKEFRSRHLEVSYIIRSLKEMAKEFQVAMIVISSLARGDKSDTKPVLSDLKESGDIEYTSDIVCFLHREKSDLNADLIVAKNRNGRLGIVKLIWLSQKISYGTWEWKEE